MENLTHYPVLVFAAAFVSLSLASESGAWLRRRYSGASDERNEALSVILGATLTLLALIIGFTFSMATNRYDQRKNFEEAEANAIGTELLRTFYLRQMPQACASFLANISTSASCSLSIRTMYSERGSTSVSVNWRLISGLRSECRLKHSRRLLRRRCLPA